MLATWREVLGERAWVMSREEAIKDGLFGPVGAPVSDAMAARIGDVVAACAGTWAVVASKAEPLEVLPEGMHGSLTSAEQLVPMLTPAGDGARRPTSSSACLSWHGRCDLGAAGQPRPPQRR